MTVIFGTGYPAPAPTPGFVQQEDNFYLLQEDNSKLIIEQLESEDLPATHARIAHARNWLSGGTVTASTTAAGYFANAPMNTLTYEKWKPNALAATWQYTHTSAVYCDYCCIGAHTMGTSGNSLQVQYYDGGWRDIIGTVAITDNSDIFVIFNKLEHSRWRIRVSGGSAPEIGVIKFGAALQMERPIFGGHAPITLARKTVLKTNESETGEFLGISKWSSYLETSYAWQNLTATWIRQNWPDLQRAVETDAFFIAWRPQTYGEVGFGRAAAVPIPANSGVRNLMNVEMQLKARSYD